MGVRRSIPVTRRATWDVRIPIAAMPEFAVCVETGVGFLSGWPVEPGYHWVEPGETSEKSTWTRQGLSWMLR
jgi:hypothetical protein